MMSAVVFSALTVFAAVLIHRLVRSDVEGRRYLQAAAAELPLETDHLAVGLRRLAHDTRTLRIYLEGFLRDFESSPPVLVRDFDPRLTDANRQIGDWLSTCGKLLEQPDSRESCVGPSHAAIADAFRDGHWGDARTRPAAGSVIARVRVVMHEMANIERRLSEPVDPYRR